MQDVKELNEMLVPIDVSKYFHKATIVGPRGEILEDPFEIDIYQEGLQKLLEKLKQNRNGSKSKVIFAMEPTSYYHELLMEQLGKLGHEIQLINPNATARVRELDYDHIKTDDIDLKVLQRAVELGKGRMVEPKDKDIQRLRLITRQRLRRGKFIKRLKTQIHYHLDALWPGFVNRYDRKKGLVRNIWESKMAWAIMQVCPNPKKIAKMAPKQLIELFRRHKVSGIGPIRAKKTIAHAQSAVHRACYLPEIRNNLRQDLQLLHHLNTIVSDLENKAIKAMPYEAALINSIKGISPFFATAFIAEVESITKFATPKQLIKYTGLSISIKKSGMYQSRNNHFNKIGNRHLRFIVMMMARSVARCHPDFQLWFERFKKRGMKDRLAIGCVATKLLKTIHNMLTKRVEYSSKEFNKKK
ncbi:MAG: IS110 family transposase [Candidatus Margulisiibacteriota bacterium]